VELEEMEWAEAGMFSNFATLLLITPSAVERKRTGIEKLIIPKQYEDKTSKSLMMLPTDMALVSDKAFKQHVELYAKDEEVFFKDFSAVLLKLFELGVPFAESSEQNRMVFKTTTS
jgi:catalase (peroxidase I)